MSRKTAREVAMKLTYEHIFGCDDTYADVLEKSDIIEEPSSEDIKFATELVKGVQDNIEEIDKLIADSLRGWTISRMPRVDLSILRNAVYELIFDKCSSDAIVINEAVELAHVFCDERSPKFINGVLGSISRGKTERTVAVE